jgi:hypothetical protein
MKMTAATLRIISESNIVGHTRSKFGILPDAWPSTFHRIKSAVAFVERKMGPN